MNNFLVFIVFCLTNYKVCAQTSGNLKVNNADTIVWSLEKGDIEISFVSDKIAKTIVTKFGNLLPNQILNAEYDNNIIGILINSSDKNFEYYLFEFKDEKWTIKFFQEWRDISRFVGLYKPELFEDIVEDAKLINPYEVNIVYKNKPLIRKYIFSLNGKKQIVETIRK